MNKTDYKSPMKIIRHNDKLRRERLQQTIKANFSKSDYFITLHYTAENRLKDTEAKKVFNELINELKGKYKALGIDIKYIKSTRTGKRGGITHYLMLGSGCEADKVKQCWWLYASSVAKIKTLGELKPEELKRAFLPDESNSFKIFERAYTGSRNLKRK